jgi:glycosyltransferase involved in cell wall biosynthesis
MRITYVLPYPEMGGGNKVIFQHADLLRGLGHEVTLVGEGARPTWFDVGDRYFDSSAGPLGLPEQDLVIATYWTTLRTASRLVSGPLAHFCQGYEGGLEHLRPSLAEIEAAYAQDLPTLTVAPHLGELLAARFGRESRVVSPPLDPLFCPAWRLRPRRRPRVAVPGIFAAEVKGVGHALRAVKRLRELGYPCRVVRFSTLPLTPEERELLAPDLYRTSVPAGEVAKILRACDLLLFPSQAEEGFGLPLLEAMAAKVPAVASDIHSVRFIGDGAVRLVPPADPEALAQAARELLDDAGAWRAARKAGFESAQRFAPAKIAAQLEEGVAWARARALERRTA